MKAIIIVVLYGILNYIMSLGLVDFKKNLDEKYSACEPTNIEQILPDEEKKVVESELTFMPIDTLLNTINRDLNLKE